MKHNYLLPILGFAMGALPVFGQPAMHQMPNAAPSQQQTYQMQSNGAPSQQQQHYQMPSGAPSQQQQHYQMPSGAPSQQQQWNQNQMQGQGSPGQVSTIQWFTNYNQAVAAAKQSNKPILLFFTGSDWCGWCKKMHQEVFSSPDFVREVGNQFIFVDVDFPMNKQLPQDIVQQNVMLKQKFGVTGYPTVVILDANENFIAETGYRPGGGRPYAEYLKQLMH